MSQRISTKFVTVSHKYYFNNETEHTILIRKYAGVETGLKQSQANFDVRTYTPYSKQSFYLFEDDLVNPK